MYTQETAITLYADAKGTKLAYRRLGVDSGIPLVMLMHFRGNMDFWDPALINALARSRPIILLDNAGIGKSEGEIPICLHGWAENVINLLEVLNVPQIDLLGFSMGGGAAQHVALAAPQLVRRLILAGTRTSGNPGTVIGPRDIFKELAETTSEKEFEGAVALSFFNPSPHGKAAARASWERVMSRAHQRSPHLDPKSAQRQTQAFKRFSDPHPLNPFERIGELKMPVLVANGDNDLLIPTINSIELVNILPNGYLHVYPNSGHGFLFQYAELFTSHVAIFLDSEGLDGFGEVASRLYNKERRTTEGPASLL
ncbi:Alpha/Beta hydrolase protein [Amylocarpus encephaloides]|uniref:Alpha/Beta hydrolase protein n=1 Tax=Amylocarpus encephaloides TaxID=45428 RepID=A0A9P7YD37_9HELO|nr:Alpha/Beta hydrolase protein [Amylocarpus encephaloides]